MKAVLRGLLLLLTVGKFSKVLLSGGSMVLAVFTYAMIYGWRYAVGFVGLILIHEMGHYLAARQRGLAVGLPTFIPFLGAWIQLKEQVMDAETEAYVGIAGPILGSVGAFVCYLVYSRSGDPLYLALAYAGFMINLFNLIPLSPLDGGRIVAIISERIWLVGVPVLVGLLILHPSPVLVIVLVLAAPGVLRLIRNKGQPTTDRPQAPLNARIGYGVQYLILLAFLGLMTAEVGRKLDHGRDDPSGPAAVSAALAAKVVA